MDQLGFRPGPATALAYVFEMSYEFRRTLLCYLSATDIAMLVSALKLHITTVEREGFMNPIRDFGVLGLDIRKMISMGFVGLLFGPDCQLLMKRIATPVAYCKQHGRSLILKFGLVFYKPCPRNETGRRILDPHLSTVAKALGRLELPVDNVRMPSTLTPQIYALRNPFGPGYNFNSCKLWDRYFPLGADHICCDMSRSIKMGIINAGERHVLSSVSRELTYGPESNFDVTTHHDGYMFLDIINLKVDPFTIARIPAEEVTYGQNGGEDLSIVLVSYQSGGGWRIANIPCSSRIHSDYLISQPRIMSDYENRPVGNRDAVELVGVGGDDYQPRN